MSKQRIDKNQHMSQLMRAYGTYHTGHQRRQSRQSLRRSHTLSMEVEEGFDQKSDI